jgi:hypothetical protein
VHFARIADLIDSGRGQVSCDEAGRQGSGRRHRTTVECVIAPPAAAGAAQSALRARRGDGGWRGQFAREIEDAVRHIGDPLVLDSLPLARLPAMQPYMRRFAGRTAARGLGLQAMLQDAARRTAEYSASSAFARFACAYIDGASVAAAARHAGVTREHASRVYRTRLIERLTGELLAVLLPGEG